MSEQVTVIMPVYNPGKYLRPCLDSLLAQTMKDFRIIAIDDGSTDNSWDVLQEYAAQDARILPQKNPYNIGAARTRNIGIQLAQGEYVVILDADDYFDPDYLECMWTACKENDLDIAICDFYRRDELAGKEILVTPPHTFQSIINKPFTWKEIPLYIFQLFQFPPYLKMYRRIFISEYSVLFQDLSNSNDVYFSEMSLIYANRIMHIAKPLLHYRYNTGQQISTPRGRNIECLLWAFMKTYNELCRFGIYEALKKGFFAHVAFTVCACSGYVSREKESAYFELWQERGLPSLDMFNLTRECFNSSFAYKKWQALKTGCNFEDLITEVVFKEETYRAFFHESSVRNLGIAHWGYGKLGKEFQEYAQKYNFQVVEFYDKDCSKWGEYNGICVKSFHECSPLAEMIVVTNERFIDDVLNQTMGTSLKVFDFTAYCLYGVGFEESICY